MTCTSPNSYHSLTEIMHEKTLTSKTLSESCLTMANLKQRKWKLPKSWTAHLQKQLHIFTLDSFPKYRHTNWKYTVSPPSQFDPSQYHERNNSKKLFFRPSVKLSFLIKPAEVWQQKNLINVFIPIHWNRFLRDPWLEFIRIDYAGNDIRFCPNGVWNKSSLEIPCKSTSLWLYD